MSVCEVESATLVLFDREMSVPRWLYTAFLRTLLPLVFVRLWLRGRQSPAYRLRWRERLGWAPVREAMAGAPERPPFVGRPLWIHAVSVGETLAALPLVQALRRQYPDLPLLITTMTPTGSERVRAIWGDDVLHVYAPYDVPGAITRFLAHWQPRALVVMETELWPNWLAAARSRGLPVMLANARLSERSAKGYARLGRMTQELMASLTVVAAQDAPTAERFRQLGVPANQVIQTGSLKFDISIPDEVTTEAARWRVAWALYGRPVWVAASTHAGEDGLMLEAHQLLRQTQPDALLILVPRHPERFESVAQQVRDAGLTMARRSQGDVVTPDTAVLLGDSMGELLCWFALSQAAFVGGSLVPTGGHNALEPLALGVPALTGPHFFNFEAINQALLAAGALAVVSDADELARALTQLFTEPALVQTRREAGLAVLATNRGAVARQLALLAPWLGEAS